MLKPAHSTLKLLSKPQRSRAQNLVPLDLPEQSSSSIKVLHSSVSEVFKGPKVSGLEGKQQVPIPVKEKKNKRVSRNTNRSTGAINGLNV